MGAAPRRPGSAHHDRGPRAPRARVPQAIDLLLGGFGPPTLRSRIGRRSVAARANRSQISESIANRGGGVVQPSQSSTGVSKDFTTRLLPEIGTAFAPGTAPKVATTPTTADLVALHGGRDRRLRIADVAERLGVCAATVYRLCPSSRPRRVRRRARDRGGERLGGASKLMLRVRPSADAARWSESSVTTVRRSGIGPAPTGLRPG
jgi:hypothetical protein